MRRPSAESWCLRCSAKENKMSRELTLLICTVGGSPEPLVESILYWRPSRIRFLPTPQTRACIEEQIIPKASARGFEIAPGCYDVSELPNGQDFAACVQKLRAVTPEVAPWLDRGPGYRIVVDLTGGTKCMSAALATQAHRWVCTFSYVGGGERTKDGVGIVVSGKEQVIYTQNPWERLGYQALEDALLLFNTAQFAAVAALLDSTLPAVQDHARKRELQGMKILAQAYDLWERFDHRTAEKRLGEVYKYENDLRSALGIAALDALMASVRRHLEQLGTISGGPSMALVLDLLANADRRRREGRFDDALARLYRAIEAYAQNRMLEHFKIASGAVPVENLPSPLKERWAPHARDGLLKLGLQDDYELLGALGDPAGQRFAELKLNDRESALASRNTSILAHGFAPIGEKAFQSLWTATLALMEAREEELVVFPRVAR
jgi:CRISPR-associated protein (TIGR02710 family)